MGCYFCGDGDCIDRFKANAAAMDIATRAKHVLGKLREIQSKLHAIAVQPFDTVMADKWKEGKGEEYLTFLQKVRQKRQPRFEPGARERKLTKRLCEKATKTLRDFCQGLKNEIPPPDREWYIVVYELASNYESLRGLEISLQKACEDYEEHLRLSKATVSQYKAVSRKSVEDSKEENKAIEEKLETVKPQLEKTVEVSRICVITLKTVLEGEEETEEEEMEGQTAPANGELDGKGEVAGQAQTK